jgi:UDP-N-acetylmuramoyl-tripeptide--D-alanyl-D-alanine ligase
MSALTPEKIEKYSRGKWFRGISPTRIGNIQFDSRDIRQGDCFVALKTGKRDAHEFVKHAADAGATSAIVERPDMASQIPQLVADDTLDSLHRIAAGIRREFKGTLVGITGSCGKTSTKELLALLLGEKVLYTEGNLNNYIGMPLTLTRLDPSVHEKAVVEVGISQKGEMRPLAEILAPTLSIVTCVASAHLEGLGSIEGVAEEKATLPAIMGRTGHAFFPSGCLKWIPFQELGAKCFVTAAMDEETPVFSSANYSLVRYQTLHTSATNSEMLLLMPGAENFARIILPRLSKGMQSNAALAFALALDLGISEQTLRERLSKWTPAKMRGEIRHFGNTSFYIDCYNANPSSMIDAISNFREEFEIMPRLYMLGCMNELGPQTEKIHENLGHAIGKKDDETFCIFGKEGESLRAGLVNAGVPEKNVTVISDKNEGSVILDNFRKKQGAVFVKGSHGYHMEDFIPQN